MKVKPLSYYLFRQLPGPALAKDSRQGVGSSPVHRATASPGLAMALAESRDYSKALASALESAQVLAQMSALETGQVLAQVSALESAQVSALVSKWGMAPAAVSAKL